MDEWTQEYNSDSNVSYDEFKQIWENFDVWVENHTDEYVTGDLDDWTD